MKTAEQLALDLAPRLGYTPSREQIAVALLDVDQAAISTTVGKRVKWEIWDKTSPINGVDAETVMSHRDDYQGGEVFLIYVDDQLTFFQPTLPDDGSQMDEKTAKAAAKAQVAEIVAELSDSEVVNAVAAQITAPAPSAPPLGLVQPNAAQAPVSNPDLLQRIRETAISGAVPPGT